MAGHLPNNGNIVQQVEEIFNTYRTPFCLNEHHWYVQCDCNQNNRDENIHLYTIPYCSNRLTHLYRSIRRLDLMHSSDWGYLENIELSLLANSPLGRQCEVLLIKVSVRENIFDLINTMPNLRALTCSIISLRQVKSNDDEASSSNMIKYDLLWLQNYLSFTSSIHLKPLFKLSQSNEYSIKLSYLQLVKERQSSNKNKLVPYNSIVGVASSNVIAYSNGNDTYYSNENHYIYGIYMGLKWQCVEYARRWTFFRKSSIFESVVGANDIWNQIKYIERIIDKEKFPLKKHFNGSPNPPINETYLIYPIQKDMPYGHISVIVDVLKNSIRIAEQNFYFTYWKDNYAREIPFVYKNGLYYIEDEYEIYGWLEIDDSKEQLKPLNKLTIEKIQMKYENM
ncbi:unnamed protein product [Rotaria sordida]|uniref:Peptidase C51 domain-containing protein n=1 Tax=Rotaria sordida TaxID=392033 RepID=A0A819VD16_9BILA|nr:unnamed protein product [Rotaria sordida]